MEHGHFNSNTNDERGADRIGAGSSETPESLVTELENCDNVETTERENNNSAETKTEGKTKEKQYPCKFCPKLFDKHQALGGHMNGHTKDERNRDKKRKYDMWHRAAFPDKQNIISSDPVMQGTPSNRVPCNCFSHSRETDCAHGQLGQPWTAQQASQQIESFQGLQTQQRQGLQNHQAQGSQRYQAQGSQRYQAQGPQNHLAQGPQNHQAQGSQTYQAQGSQRYQVQGPQNHQAQGLQTYQAQGLQTYQAPQGPRRQLVSDVNNQRRITVNPNISNGPAAPARVPSNVYSSYVQGPHAQVEVNPQQGPGVYMPGPHNMHIGYRPTTSVGAPANVQTNSSFYAQHPQGLGRGTGNQMIDTPHHRPAAQYRPGNSPNTYGSVNHPEDELLDEQWILGVLNEHHTP